MIATVSTIAIILQKLVPALCSFQIDSYNSSDYLMIYFQKQWVSIVVPTLVAQRPLSTEWRKNIIWRVESVQVYHLILQIPQKWKVPHQQNAKKGWGKRKRKNFKKTVDSISNHQNTFTEATMNYFHHLIRKTWT